jgi:hypothetical protein
VWNAGPIVFVIKVSRDPAENTSTSPLGKALLELGELAAELGELGELAELAGVVEELLQPAAVSPMQAIDAITASCAPRR